MKVIIIPGNNNTLITDNWYPYAKDELEKFGLEVVAEDMPDPVLARKKFWVPFIKEKLDGEEDSILIGHSSGAVAALKYLEDNKCRFVILVACYYSHLDDDLEKKSGYFDEPWKWDQIKDNAEKIVIFASKDDPFIPISEPRFVKEKVGAEYYEYKNDGHFGLNRKKEFPEIIMVVRKMLETSNLKS
jgi:predicted alpha/beta hydrolase family esterase